MKRYALEGGCELTMVMNAESSEGPGVLEALCIEAFSPLLGDRQLTGSIDSMGRGDVRIVVARGRMTCRVIVAKLRAGSDVTGGSVAMGADCKWLSVDLAIDNSEMDLASARVWSLWKHHGPRRPRSITVVAGVLLKPEHRSQLLTFASGLARLTCELDARQVGMQMFVRCGPASHTNVGLAFLRSAGRPSHVVEIELNRLLWSERRREECAAAPGGVSPAWSAQVWETGWLTYLPRGVVAGLGGPEALRESLAKALGEGWVSPEARLEDVILQLPSGAAVIVLDPQLPRAVSSPIGQGDLGVAGSVCAWLHETLDARGLRL